MLKKYGVIIESLNYHSNAMVKTAEAHMGTVRLHAYWRFLETTQGNFNFNILDQYVNDAVRTGLDVYLTLGLFPPQWANGTAGQTCNIFRDDCASLPPTNTQYFKTFVRTVVNRYKGKVKFYAIWNEPDLKVFWNGEFQRYISEILIPGAVEVKATDPNAKVLGPEIASSAARVGVAVGAACNKLDIITVHLFKDTPTENLNQFNNRYVPEIQANCPNKPIWVTAFGARESEHGEAGQAQFLVDMYTGLRANPKVARTIFYTLIDLSNGLKQGVIRRPEENYLEKQAYRDLKALFGSWLP